ncbi:MAG: GNAT family N-acetyltransferase [Peptococcaceae bacterium]|nr:GNAT family N-acetyltransferase [Peptococcaceae bacterium]
MIRSVSVENLDAISRLHGCIQGILESRLKVKMHISDFMEDNPGQNSLGVLFTSDAGAEAEAPGGPARREEPDRKTGPAVFLVGKHRDFQQFLNKEGPFYDEEFMLDLEFNFDTKICTIHHINLPGRLRGKGLGSAIIEKTEKSAGEMGMRMIYVPSEHRATHFWLKNGYQFGFSRERSFYEKNREKPNLYVAYDLRKRIAG